MRLKDHALFRLVAVVGHRRVNADPATGISGNNLAASEIIGHMPKLGS